VKSKEILQTAYGKEFDVKQFALFFEMIQEDGWTTARLEFAVKTLIKTNKYARVNIADLYNIGPKLHGYNWFLEQPAGSTEMFNVNGNKFWASKAEVAGLKFPNMQEVNDNKLTLDLSNALGYFRTQLKREPSETERTNIISRLKSDGIQAVIDKIDTHARNKE